MVEQVGRTSIVAVDGVGRHIEELMKTSDCLARVHFAADSKLKAHILSVRHIKLITGNIRNGLGVGNSSASGRVLVGKGDENRIDAGGLQSDTVRARVGSNNSANLGEGHADGLRHLEALGEERNI